MNKRAAGANFGTGEERYGGELANTMENDKPLQATAAQMARRKIAQARRPGANRARSGSPAVPQTNTGGVQGSLFGNSNPPQQQAQNPFQSSNFNFTFGGAPQQQESSASPAPFQFGSSAAPASTNGNGNVFANNTPSFGGSFTGGSSQPQQNGFNPSTTSAFNQSSQSTSTNTFSFGQTQQSQQNGFTPASTASNTFGGFGKPQENSQANTSSFAFGSTQQEKDKASTPFSGLGASQQEKEKSATPFGGLGTGQQERERSNTPFSGFGMAQSEKESSKPANPFAGFGASQSKTQDSQASTTPFGSFGQSQQENNNKSGTPSFSGFGQQKPLFQMPNGDATKNAEKETTPNPFSGFKPSQVNGENAQADQTPKSTPFSFGQSGTPQPEQPSSNMFSGFSKSTSIQNENKGLFGSSLLPATTSSSTESVFSKLPKKDLSNGGKPLFDSSDPSQIYRGEDDHENNDEAGSGGGNLFNQSKPQFSQSAGNLFSKSTGQQSFSGSSLFQKSANTESDVSMSSPGRTPKTHDMFSATKSSETPTTAANNASVTPATGRSLFDRADKDDVAKRLGGPLPTNQSTETPKATLFGTTPTTPATAKPATQAPPSAAAPSAGSLFKPAQPSQLAQSQTASTPPPKNMFDRADRAAPQTALFTPVPPKAAAPAINAPATAPPAKSAMILSEASGSGTAPQSMEIVLSASLNDAQKARFKDLNNGMLSLLKGEDDEKDWTGIFDYYASLSAEILGRPPQGPRATPASTSTTSPGATAGALPQSSGSHLHATSSKKRSLPDDNDSSQGPGTEKRNKPNGPISYPKLPETASSTAKLFEAAIDSPKPATASGFKPSTTTAPSAASTGGFKPSTTTAASAVSTGGFKPSLGASQGGGSSFLSAFGNKAQQQLEKDRKKRKNEDYDSDEETEEQWEKRDREEQEAKRRKFEEAAKGAKGFMLSGTSASTSGSTPQTPFKFGVSTSASTSTTPAVPPPKFGGLFGAGSATPSEPGKLAPPSVGFNFGSSDASRATSPGVTTDGEASNATDGECGEPSDEQHTQSDADDHTALQSSEREASDVLLELQNTIIKTFAKTEDSDKAVWSTIGSGRLYVLKDKATSKTRLLNKVGLGRTALNFTTVPGMKYEKHPKKDTMVVAPFMDHLHHTPPKFERFYITTENASEATELAKILTDGASAP